MVIACYLHVGLMVIMCYMNVGLMIVCCVFACLFDGDNVLFACWLKMVIAYYLHVG